MKINGMAHCLFEQSGTFKNAFKSFGIHAEDYDIQDNFGETDHVVDIFQGIEDAWDGKPSLFDRVTRDDIVLAFFPCIYFCGISQMNITLASYEYKHGTLDGAGEYILDRIDKRTRFYKLLVKLCTLSIARGFRLVVENPYTTNTYLKGNFIKPPSIVDTDRTVRGDYFVKPTAYWFFGCEPMHSLTRQPTRDEDKKHILVHTAQKKTHPGGNFAKGSKESGVCSEERSMLSPAYARNFISDFILGEGGAKTVPQQLDMFDIYGGAENE